MLFYMISIVKLM